jgi:DNA polymerase III delta subunit
MIYLLYGTDTDKARGKLNDLVGSLLKKKPDASHLKITDESFDPAQLEELIGSMGLFSSKAIIEVVNAFRNKDAKEIVLKKLKEIKESENIFVFLEGELDKATLAKFEKNSEKIQEFQSHSAEAPRDTKFNIFSLTEAFGKRDKKQLWVLYTKAKMKDVADEEIHGILFWQLKAILQASAAKSAGEAGLNPFVYQKSLGFSKNFKPEELRATSSKLVSLYHDARRGIHDCPPCRNRTCDPLLKRQVLYRLS